MNREEALELAERGVDELIVALEQGRSERLLEYLAFQAKFHRYSFNNSLLIAIQKPDATFVAGFQRWKELGRFVRKGEMGIVILAPLVRRSKPDAELFEKEDESGRAVVGFRATHVFDVAQTDGDELPQFSLISGEPGELIPQLRQVIARQGIELRYEENLDGAKGVSEGGRIALVTDLPPAEEFAVLAHELAHELLHRTERRKETTRAIRELEAEAVAFVVAKAAGLDGLARSSDYIQLYSGDKEMLLASLAHIQRVAAKIIDELVAVNETNSAVTGCQTAEVTI
ncbi:MAG: ArdC family protein [Pirellulales bacterium]|nr:ArdC family protein [Pirellulales bacterium]